MTLKFYSPHSTKTTAFALTSFFQGSHTNHHVTDCEMVDWHQTFFPIISLVCRWRITMVIFHFTVPYEQDTLISFNWYSIKASKSSIVRTTVVILHYCWPSNYMERRNAWVLLMIWYDGMLISMRKMEGGIQHFIYHLCTSENFFNLNCWKYKFDSLLWKSLSRKLENQDTYRTKIKWY